MLDECRGGNNWYHQCVPVTNTQAVVQDYLLWYRQRHKQCFQNRFYFLYYLEREKLSLYLDRLLQNI